MGVEFWGGDGEDEEGYGDRGYWVFRREIMWDVSLCWIYCGGVCEEDELGVGVVV